MKQTHTRVVKKIDYVVKTETVKCQKIYLHALLGGIKK